MSHTGYDVERFVGNSHQPFVCIICLNVVLEPYECRGCGKLFCKVCITNWAAKNNDNKCPNCINNCQIVPIFSRALQRLYASLDIKCINPKCKQVTKLSDLVKHEEKCLIVKCWNYDACETARNETIKANRPCCSEMCSTILSLVEKFGDKKALYDILGRFINSRPISPPHFPIVEGQRLVWDDKKIGGGVVLTEGGAQCFLKEQSYLFRTALTVSGFTSGTHYWEILADNRTENELKIGVVTNKDFDYNSAFCDHPFGFAYYGLGQLRHNSNASGPSYGKKFKKEGVLGVCLNMKTGVLGFSLNGEYMGVAYKDTKLTQGPIYPAVALLHCAGCKIKSGLPVPSFFKD